MTSTLHVVCVRRHAGEVSHVGVRSLFLRAMPMAAARVVRELRHFPGALFVVDPSGARVALVVDAQGRLALEGHAVPLADVEWVPDFEPGSVPEWAFDEP